MLGSVIFVTGLINWEYYWKVLRQLDFYLAGSMCCGKGAAAELLKILMAFQNIFSARSKWLASCVLVSRSISDISD